MQRIAQQGQLSSPSDTMTAGPSQMSPAGALEDQ